MNRYDEVVLVGPSNQPLAWHHLPDDIVYKRLQTSSNGISEDQVKERLQEFGKNTLPERRPPTIFEVIIHQFKSPLIYILVAAGVIALLTGDYKDAGFILGVIALNATIGTVQEWKAEKSAHALQELLKVKGLVRRQGRQYLVDAEELVPGDIVLLESGDKVPADLRLVLVNNLAINESFLTGESLAAEKTLTLLEADVPVNDRSNMAYAGSTIITGRGTGLVIATGKYTEVGKIAQTVADEVGAKPPLIQRMEYFSKQISFAVLFFAAILGLIAFNRGMAVNEVLFLVIAMSVSAIPEGLPVAMTVALSLATSRMAKRNVIVRKLPAVESLGSCNIVASDKTGTLTVNQQTVRSILFFDGSRFLVGGQGYNDEGQISVSGDSVLDKPARLRLEELGRNAILCNEAVLEKNENTWIHNGDAMDVALLAFAGKLGLNPKEIREKYLKLAEIPFESEKRYAATVNRAGARAFVVVKGALETVLSFCSTMSGTKGAQPLDVDAVNQQALSLAEEGFRVLALASMELAPKTFPDQMDETMLTGMTLQAIIGFIDPLRPEAVEAVRTAQNAGVRVSMITGDHPATAFAIARDLGIANSVDQVITGQELAEIGDVHVPEFYERVKHASVFARVSPDQKLYIVDAMITLGNYVAVTGDGVNDAPALRKANIGVAMGSGTDVAKDTASIIVMDDNFASIVAGIEEGRHAYANVRKVTLFLISTGLAELLLIGLSILAGLPIPLLAVQILWLNLVTNGIQDVALAFEAGEPGVMKSRPRPSSEGIFNRKMIEQVLITGVTMALVCFAAWIWLLDTGLSEVEARTSLLTLLVLMQFYHVLNCRSENTSVFKIPFKNNPVLIIGMVVAFLLHVLATQWSVLQSLLRTQSIMIDKWIVFSAIGVIILLIMEIYKWLNRNKF